MIFHRVARKIKVLTCMKSRCGQDRYLRGLFLLGRFYRQLLQLIIVVLVKFIDRYPRLEARVSYKRKGFYYLVVTFFLGKVTLSKCQISSTYSWMVLSDVNLPLHATFRIALFAQPFSSLYAASTRFCASA